MKITRQLAVIAALGTLAFATSKVQAALLDVTIKGSVTTQATTTTNNGVILYKETKTTVGTQDILKTLGTIKGIGTPPDGSTIVYDTEATTTNIFTIRNKDGAVLADCTANIEIESNEGETVTGKFTQATKAESTTTSFFGTILFAPGNSNEFILNGLTTSKLSVSAPKNGVSKVSETVTLKSGAGPARVNGAFGTASGSVTFKGSGTVSNTNSPASK